jgi:DNA-binding HxlR family transcriptional regulator
MSNPHRQACPIARMLNIFGDHWSWMIIREAFYGASRFSEFERNTGIAKNLLTERLSLLVGEGVLEKRDIGANGTRYAYFLTDKGRDLNLVLIAMVQWGNKYLFEQGKAPIEIVERATGKPISLLQPLAADAKPLAPEELQTVPGPGAGKAIRHRLSQVS